MPIAPGTSVRNGDQLEVAVQAIAHGLDLNVVRKFVMGLRITGQKREIDLLVSDDDGNRVGIECKYQYANGSMEDKVFKTMKDMEAWPRTMGRLIVFSGPENTQGSRIMKDARGKRIGWSHGTISYLISQGHVRLEGVEEWLKNNFSVHMKKRERLLSQSA